jgi:predicted nucleic acid-binding protein
MTVFAETNFLLELAYQQEEHESCEEILALAEAGRIDLVVPAFCVVEARMTHARQVKQRAEFHRELLRQVRELSRSRPYSDVAARSRELMAALVEGAEEERRLLRVAVDRIGAAGRFAPTTLEVLLRADRAESEANLKPPDAIVYGSVVTEINADPGTPKCFLNRNSRDFLSPDIDTELRRSNCHLIPSFRDGLAFITHSIASQVEKNEDAAN